MGSKIQGEGDYESARHYNDETKKFVAEHTKGGKEIKGNVDGGMYMGIGPESEDGQVVANASVDVSGGIEGSRSKLTGATFSFPATKEGTQALIDFVDKMITEEQVSTEDWLGAEREVLQRYRQQSA